MFAQVGNFPSTTQAISDGRRRHRPVLQRRPDRPDLLEVGDGRPGADPRTAGRRREERDDPGPARRRDRRGHAGRRVGRRRRPRSTTRSADDPSTRGSDAPPRDVPAAGRTPRPGGRDPHPARPWRSRLLRRGGAHRPVRLRRPVLRDLPRVRAVPAGLHRLDQPAPLPARLPDELGRPGQLRLAVHQPVLLQRAVEDVHDRRALDGPAARAGPRPGPPAQLPAARADVPARRDADALRHVGRRGDAGLRADLRPGRGPGERAARRRRHRPRRLAQRRLDGPGRHLGDRHLALDRLQRADLPGRHAVDQPRPVRGGGARRREPLAAVPARHAARAAPDDPVHGRRLDDRRQPALRRAAAVRRRAGQRRPGEPVPDPRAVHVPAGLAVRAARPGGRRSRG